MKQGTHSVLRKLLLRKLLLEGYIVQETTILLTTARTCWSASTICCVRMLYTGLTGELCASGRSSAHRIGSFATCFANQLETLRVVLSMHGRGRHGSATDRPGGLKTSNVRKARHEQSYKPFKPTTSKARPGNRGKTPRHKPPAP